MLSSLREINSLPQGEKERIYGTLLPERILEVIGADRSGPGDRGGMKKVKVIAPEGLGLVRIEARMDPEGRDTVFFLDLADTSYRQIELAFCAICDPRTPRFDVDVDQAGRDNWFASLGRNLSEEQRAMEAGLFPNQVRRGLRSFRDFFPRFERFVDSLGVEMIVAEPLSYDNAIRYEGYGFDYLTGKRLMQEIDREFRPGGRLHARLDGSTPFRRPGMERTVRGRSWAVHDGILDEPWDGVMIYKMVGVNAGIDTFPAREHEEEQPSDSCSIRPK